MAEAGGNLRELDRAARERARKPCDDPEGRGPGPQTSPLTSTAAVNVWPDEICVNRQGEPAGQTTGTGRELHLGPVAELLMQEVVVGAPNWPSMFRPQQNATPLCVRAQV